MVDYRDLLKRYIKYVVDQEGTDFICRLIGLNDVELREWGEEDFTEEEVKELRTLLPYETDETGNILIRRNAVL
jgi:hypothetical protein